MVVVSSGASQPSRVQAKPAPPRTSSKAPAFLHNHVSVVVQKDPAVVHVQHAQRPGLHGGTAGGGDSVGLVPFQQTLEGTRGSVSPHPSGQVGIVSFGVKG